MFRPPKIETRPGYHDTLRQSVENPAQLDRLPTDRALGLEHRTRVTTSAERRALYLFFAWQFGWRIALLIFAKLLSVWRFSFGNYYFAILILIGLVTSARGLLARQSAGTRWFAYLVACPLLAAPAFLFDRSYYNLTLGFVALTFLADGLATHHFYSATSGMRPRLRRWHRLAWKNRFNLQDSASRRIPCYVAAAGAPLILLAIILYRRQEPSRYFFTDDLYVLGGAVLVATVIFACVEPALNFLYGQPIKPPWSLLRLAWQTVADWSTYNLHDRKLPGLFISPAGSLRPRLDLLFGVFLLVAVPFTELCFYVRVSLPGGERNIAKEAIAENTVPALEPYQKALLARMDPERRKAYFKSLAASRRERLEIPRSIREKPKTMQDVHDNSIKFSYLMLLSSAGPVPYQVIMFIPPLLLVPFVFFLCVIPTIARADSVAGVSAASTDTDVESDTGPRLWEHFVSSLQTSPNTEDKHSFFLGFNAVDRSPIIVPRRVFEEHAHFLGDSGAGKTTLGLAPLISQMIRARDCSVVIIDLKGDDPSLFENARIEAEQAGLPFRWFTNELGKSTYVFNPLLQRHLAELSLYQRTDLLTASLGLQYGTDYGRGFFSDANAELLYHALRARPYLRSFVELSHLLKQREPFRSVSAQLKMAGAHLAAIVTRLGSTEALNAQPATGSANELLDAAIDMRQAFEEPQVVYFHLASALGTATSAEIARMAMFSLLSASKFVQGKRQQVFLVVDEFQRAVSNNLELFLQTARSMNIGVILANQSLSDLKKPGVDIVSTVRTNTRYRQIFAAGEMHDLQELILTSGETLIHSTSWNQTIGYVLSGPAAAIRSKNTSELVSPRLRINDLLLASDHPLQSICHVRRGEGFAQFGGMPFIMESSFHISEDEYNRRKQATWPVDGRQTFTPTLASTDPIASEANPTIDRPSDETQASAAAAQRLFSGLDEHYAEQKHIRQKSSGPSRPSDQ